jgi:Na+/melibiose symporter-like transporter
VAAFFAEGVRTAFILSGILTLAVGKMLFAAGWHALIGGLVPETHRARFYSRMRLAFQAGGILFAGVVALLLGRDSPLWMFQLILGFLVLCFLLRVFFYVRVPELERTGERHGGFWPALGRVLSNSQYVSFCAYVFLLTLFTKGAMNLFALVEKHVLELSDSMVVLLANTSMAGGILGFLLVGRFVDRVGTRHVFLVCHCAFAVSMFVFLARGGFPCPVVVPVAAAHFVFGVSGAASGIAIMTEMLALIPPANKALSTSVCISLVLGGASLSGLLAAGVLDLGVLREHWVLWGQAMSRYDAVLLAYATMVLLLVITLGLVPSVLRPPGWPPPGSTE